MTGRTVIALPAAPHGLAAVDPSTGERASGSVASEARRAPDRIVKTDVFIYDMLKLDTRRPNGLKIEIGCVALAWQNG